MPGPLNDSAFWEIRALTLARNSHVNDFSHCPVCPSSLLFSLPGLGRDVLAELLRAKSSSKFGPRRHGLLFSGFFAHRKLRCRVVSIWQEASIWSCQRVGTGVGLPHLGDAWPRYCAQGCPSSRILHHTTADADHGFLVGTF